ncbi:hypothetical protein BJV78DRAFT_1286974 [Lactifluus subvellereus]|nr:hypothetical protein BJV78DRAFT_1286974 [Lactifluus subvellereus]
MPLKGKKSTTARQKCHDRHAAFTKQSMRQLCSEGSEYSDDATDTPTTDMDSTDERQEEVDRADTVDTLRHLYSIFLPPQERLRENTREKRQKMTGRMPVYTGNSRTTAWQKDAAQKKAAEGCMKIDAFLSQKKHQHNTPSPEYISISSDSDEIESTVPMDITNTMINSEDKAIADLIDDLAALCLNQPMASMTEGNWPNVNTEEQGFEVELDIAMTAADDAMHTQPELTRDSEVQSLPSEAPVVEAAQELFSPEDEWVGRDAAEPEDITAIVQSCLKDVKKHKTSRAVKMFAQLIAVSEYVKLRKRYQKRNTCKQPCLSASMAIARRMGKGPYFARQIRHNELYLCRHRQLPPPNTFAQHGHHSLLDNEVLLHDVRMYLATQALGTVTPRTLCHHVNEVILPALKINGKIIESTAQR